MQEGRIVRNLGSFRIHSNPSLLRLKSPSGCDGLRFLPVHRFVFQHWQFAEGQPQHTRRQQGRENEQGSTGETWCANAHTDGHCGEHEPGVAGQLREVGDVLVGHEEDDDVGEDEEGEEIKEKHRAAEIALTFKGAERPRGERIQRQQHVHTSQAARQGLLLLNEARHALIGVVVVLCRHRHPPEIQGRGKEHEEGHGLERNERHITVYCGSRGFLNVSQILEHITNHEQAHHLELLSNRDGERFGNRSDELVDLVGEDDGEGRVEGVQVGVEESVHVGDIKRR